MFGRIRKKSALYVPKGEGFMNAILIAVLVVGVIGLVVAIVLSFASAFFAVPVDEKVRELTEALPGANCGACGFSGCSGYAKAMADGKAQPGSCPVGGEVVTKTVSLILGVEAKSQVPVTARVMCGGSCDNTQKRVNYSGIKSCAAAVQLFGGGGKCTYGCIGFGDCVKACEFGAIRVCNGVAIVNADLCRGCKKCAAACPKGLIDIIPKRSAVVLCSNFDKGAQTKDDCRVGCIGCMKCQKVCPTGAIKIEKFKASVDPKLCTSCGECAKVCPKGVISVFGV